MPNPVHISTEHLEEYYSLGSAALNLTIDEHLRVCQDCQDRLTAIARFHALLKAGAIRGADRHYR